MSLLVRSLNIVIYDLVTKRKSVSDTVSILWFKPFSFPKTIFGWDNLLFFRISSIIRINEKESDRIMGPGDSIKFNHWRSTEVTDTLESYFIQGYIGIRTLVVKRPPYRPRETEGYMRGSILFKIVDVLRRTNKIYLGLDKKKILRKDR